jgi:N6-L-threonylcarbamoyladenine synthase
VGDQVAFEPYLALIVSGGHSSLIRVDGWTRYAILGETMDDAVGEAYDKVAKLMGLGYPGGPLMDHLAAQGDPHAFDLPTPLAKQGGLDFSFSGLKTAVARLVDAQRRHTHSNPLDPRFVADVAASFQRVAVATLLDRAERALDLTGLRRLAIAGGVACNRGLRAEAARRLAGVALAFPAPEFCTDNAAMIAGLGHHLLADGQRATLGLNIAPSLGLDTDWQKEG